MGERSQAVLPANQKVVKNLLPSEVLQQVFLYPNRADVEALQISHRYFHEITSAESFGKVAPLRRLVAVNLVDDNLVIRRNGALVRFRYDSEDAVRWLRNTCVEYLNMHATCLGPEQGERALRWFIAHRFAFRIIHISVELPIVNDSLQETFLRPDPAHHWTSACFHGKIRGTLPLTSSSLENVEQLSIQSPNLHVNVDDVVCWLHRPASTLVGICRQLTLASGNIDGGFQRFLEAVREKFPAATSSREFAVTIECRPGDIIPANANAAYRKYNPHAGDLMSIEVIAGGCFNDKEILVRRRPFP